jgi:hypothetical protein
MTKHTDEAWEAIRAEWESDYDVTFTFLHEKYKIDVSTISRRAKAERWLKKGIVALINETSQRRADKHAQALQEEAIAQNETATREESENIRTAILIRHRKEWYDIENYRKIALSSMNEAHEAKDDKQKWLLAKTASDAALANIRALEVKQEGERKAWGLNIMPEESIVITNQRGKLGANSNIA